MAGHGYTDSDASQLIDSLVQALDLGGVIGFNETDLLASRLRSELGLPMPTREGVGVTVQTDRPGISLVFERQGDQFVARIDQATEQPQHEAPQAADLDPDALLDHAEQALSQASDRIDELSAIRL
jgi:hypothetical protein